MSRDEKETTGFATAALVLSIIGVVLSFIPLINNAAFVLGALALIFAIVALAKKKSIAMAIVSLVLAVAAMGITIAMQKSISDAFDKAGEEINKAGEEMQQSADDMSGKNTEDVLKNDVQVDLGEFAATQDEYGFGSSKLVVTVTNKTAEKKSFTIQIEAVDADGKRIVEDTIYANDLGAGQSQDFEAFTLVQPTDFDALKAAEFKIVSAGKI